MINGCQGLTQYKYLLHSHFTGAFNALTFWTHVSLDYIRHDHLSVFSGHHVRWYRMMGSSMVWRPWMGSRMMMSRLVYSRVNHMWSRVSWVSRMSLMVSHNLMLDLRKQDPLLLHTCFSSDYSVKWIKGSPFRLMTLSTAQLSPNCQNSTDY